VKENLFDAVPSYDGQASRVEQIDSVSHRVRWGEKDVVAPLEGGRCFLRFRLTQGSLYSYRWSPA